MDDLNGKTVVITGGASGIGLAMAEAFAGVGAKLMLADIAEDDLRRATDRLRADGADVEGTVTDVSDASQVDALRDATLARFGAVHVVCNNAGVGSGGLSWTIPAEQWRWVLGVDLFGVINGVSSFVPVLVDQGEGHIVNTASMAGLLSPGFMGPYNVAKHGVVTLSETMFAELAMLAPNVGVSVLCPGWVNTRIYDAGRYHKAGSDEGPVGEAGEVAQFSEIVRNLVSDGLDPAVVGAQVVEAVRSRRFYVLTHPAWMPLVGERAARIVAGEDPVVGQLPETTT